jgi:hypothetical protein
MVTKEFVGTSQALAPLRPPKLVQLTGEALGLHLDAAMVCLGGPEALAPLGALAFELLDPGPLAFDGLGGAAFANLGRPELAFEAAA